MIFVILGKSATGKDSIYNEMIKRYPIFERIIQYTTRPMRKNETDGVEYNFSTKYEYEKLKEKGLVIESRHYNTNHGIWTYFTVNENIDPDLTYLTIGTLESFTKIKEYFKDQIEVIPIYIWLEDHERLMRAIKREENQDNPDYLELCRRYLADNRDFSYNLLETTLSSENKISYKNEKSVSDAADFLFNIIQNLLSTNREIFDKEVVSL